MASRQGTGGKETNTDLLKAIQKANLKTTEIKKKRAYKEAIGQLEKLFKKTALSQTEKEDATSLLQTLEDTLNGEDGKDMSIKPALTTIEKLRTKLGIEARTSTERGLLPGVGGKGFTPSLDPEAAWLVFRIGLFRRWLEKEEHIPKGELEKDCKPALLDAQRNLIYMKNEIVRRFGVIRQKENDKTDCLKGLLDFARHPPLELEGENMKGTESSDPDEKIVADIKQSVWNRHRELLWIEQQLTKFVGSKGSTENQTKQEENIISRIQQLISKLDKKSKESTIPQMTPGQNSQASNVNEKLMKIKDNMLKSGPIPNHDNSGESSLENTVEMLEELDKIVNERHTQLLNIEGKLKKASGHTEKGDSSRDPPITRIETLIATLGETKQENMKRESNKSEEMNNVKKQLEALNKEIQDNKFDDKAFKKVQTKTPIKEETIIEKARDSLKEWSVENRQMKEHISNLKKAVKDRKLDKKRVAGDNKWQVDIRDIIEDTDKIVKEVESSPYNKVKSEVKQLKREMDSKSVKEPPRTNDKDEVLRTLSEMRGQIAQWSAENKQMQENISSLKRFLKERRLDKIRVNGTNQWQVDINYIIVDVDEIVKKGESFLLVQKELDEIKRQISTLNTNTANEDESRNNDSTDRKWKRELEEIRKSMQKKDELLQSVHDSVQLSDVLEGLAIIERRIIVTYKKDDARGPPKTRKTSEPTRPPKSNKDTMMESLEKMVDEVDDIMNNLTKEIKRLQEDKRSLVQEHDSMRDIIRTSKDEKQDLLLRLSNIAGAQLTTDNPNIADLSDPNRPTKLAERYREIYDNEWTDAYDVYEKERKMKEHDICSKLLSIIETAESECKAIADAQFKQLCSTLLSPVSNEVNGKLESVHLKALNDLRKQTAGLSVSSVQKQVLKDKGATKTTDAILKYQMKCVEICWYMRLQTPPVILDKSLKEGQAFNRDRYTEFTRRGKLVDFVTWPPLLLHKDGPLLGKGVAQGISRLP